MLVQAKGTWGRLACAGALAGWRGGEGGRNGVIERGGECAGTRIHAGRIGLYGRIG